MTTMKFPHSHHLSLAGPILAILGANAEGLQLQSNQRLLCKLTLPSLLVCCTQAIRLFCGGAFGLQASMV